MAMEDHERMTTPRDEPVHQRVVLRGGEGSGLLSIVLVLLALLVSALIIYSYSAPSTQVITPPTSQAPQGSPSTKPAPTTPAPTKAP